MSLLLHIVQLYFISSMTFSLFAHKEKTVGCQSCRDLRFETDWSSYLWYSTVVLKTMNLYVAGQSSSFLKSLVCKSDQLTIYFLLAAVWYCWTSSSLCLTEWTTYCITDISFHNETNLSSSILLWCQILFGTLISAKKILQRRVWGCPQFRQFFSAENQVYFGPKTLFITLPNIVLIL